MPVLNYKSNVLNAAKEVFGYSKFGIFQILVFGIFPKRKDLHDKARWQKSLGIVADNWDQVNFCSVT